MGHFGSKEAKTSRFTICGEQRPLNIISEHFGIGKQDEGRVFLQTISSKREEGRKEKFLVYKCSHLCKQYNSTQPTQSLEAAFFQSDGVLVLFDLSFPIQFSEMVELCQRVRYRSGSLIPLMLMGFHCSDSKEVIFKDFLEKTFEKFKSDLDSLGVVSVLCSSLSEVDAPIEELLEHTSKKEGFNYVGDYQIVGLNCKRAV